ncbi:MAG: glycoside hydrolase family 1 protein [Candidatus Caenarcaniphilales bacterium]|nr:glycoside hydrolase family 1 protein [Candidatus Caenarcaniphilales bacterium]
MNPVQKLFSCFSDSNTLKFPKNFLWGTATAAFQIEGHPDEYAQKLSDWAQWLDKPEKVLPSNGNGDAVKHIEHLEEDLALIHDLGAGAYRFSFNWATIHRGQDEFHEETLLFYKNLIEGLKAKEDSSKKPIRIFATLIHFVLPSWLADQGGWQNPNTACEFNNYTNVLLDLFGEDIEDWITINEPNIFLGFGYESGIWPPGKTKDWTGYLRAYQGLLTGHELAYKSIKAFNPNYRVGFSQNMYFFQSLQEAVVEALNQDKSSDQASDNQSSSAVEAGASDSEKPGESQEKLVRRSDLDKIPTVIRNQLHNWSFIESCLEIDCLDFLGVNYYTRFIYKFSTIARDPANPDLLSDLWGNLEKAPADYVDAFTKTKPKYNSLGWEIFPEGLYRVLASHKFKQLIGDLPVYITENGYSHIEKEDKLDLEDDYRVDFIKSHLQALHKCMNEGLNLQGYFYWSLIDNFEWALGMDPRFGLIHVDQKTYKRTPKKSYYYYSELIKQNAVKLG